jgi:hypothetical protein
MPDACTTLAAIKQECARSHRGPSQTVGTLIAGLSRRRSRVRVPSLPLQASDNQHLPREVAQAKETNGRSIVVTLLAFENPPEQVSVTTAGISDALPD